MNNRRENFNDLDKLYNHSAFYSYENSTPKIFRKPQYTFLKQLVKLVQDGNSVTLSRDRWCEVLQCHPKHLNRKLTLLGGDLVNIETSRTFPDEVDVGYIKVTVSPAYIFVGTKQEREYSILGWYVSRGLESFDTLKDWYVSVPYQDHLI